MGSSRLPLPFSTIIMYLCYHNTKGMIHIYLYFIQRIQKKIHIYLYFIHIIQKIIHINLDQILKMMLGSISMCSHFKFKYFFKL